MKSWIVRLGFATTIVRADTSNEARTMLAEAFGYAKKPWVAREWRIREATVAEIRAYAAMAAATRRSQPTAAQANHSRTPQAIEEKLL
jgi:hypothetical protein